MKRIFLIRHGLPEFPEGQRQCVGSTDIPLSTAGAAQAAEMARTLPQVSAVFSSPLTRAVETARAICSEYTVLDGLRELDYGQWEGLSFPEIRQNYPELYAARGGDPRLQPPQALNPTKPDFPGSLPPWRTPPGAAPAIWQWWPTAASSPCFWNVSPEGGTSPGIVK